MIEKKTSAILKVFYRNHYDGSTSSQCVRFEKDKSIADISYRENVEDAILDIVESSGIWIDKKTFIPFHMILSIESMDINSIEVRDSLNNATKDKSANKCVEVIPNSDNGLKPKNNNHSKSNSFKKSRRRPSRANKSNNSANKAN